MNYNTIIAELYPLLNADNALNLVWWTDAELLAYMDESATRLGVTGVFAEHAEIEIEASSSTYDLPDMCASVAHVTLDGAALRPASVRELDALDPEWEDATAEPERFVLDTMGLELIRVHPTPTGNGTAELIYHTYPTVAAWGTHRAPDVFGLHMKYSALAAARGKRSDGMALDIAEAARMRADVIEQACRGLFGGIK